VLLHSQFDQYNPIGAVYSVFSNNEKTVGGRQVAASPLGIVLTVFTRVKLCGNRVRDPVFGTGLLVVRPSCAAQIVSKEEDDFSNPLATSRGNILEQTWHDFHTAALYTDASRPS